jgi:cytochrome c6
MKKLLILAIAALAVSAFIAAGSMAADKKMMKISGEKEFKEHCAACHPDGGNVINPAKTLKQKDLKANGIMTPADIVKLMRKPGPGMTAFDAKMVPDKEATAIARYIMKTFK